ncbi:MAG: hypothetical protein NDJ89_17920 [Oligoflexia bacterium]|nr:hypothetical protein [Oligoflexia bacterium]
MTRNWRLFLLLSLGAGLVLRLLWLEDIEFKEDEHYHFIMTQLAGRGDPWPWVGLPSGVFIPNPGLSIWMFIGLGRLFGVSDPTELQRAVGLFNVLGISLIIPFALWFVREAKAREPWLWAFALALVNPFSVYYGRKLWPQPFLPFFSMFLLAGWWTRARFSGALVWGLFGALAGQMHMSGFFLAGGLFLWTVLFGRQGRAASRTDWSGWLTGSCLGALPLAPWFWHLLTHPAPPAAARGWDEALQLKFWVFWISNPLGFHLGNPLGLHRGASHWAQLSDFARYPLLAGYATYLNGLAHALVLFLAAWILLKGPLVLLKSVRNRKQLETLLVGSGNPTHFAQNAALFASGVLMTATRVTIRRYYMIIHFPLEFLWLIRGVHAASPDRRRARWILGVLWAAQLFISANLVWYVHVNQGSPWGDYGEAFHLIREKNLKATGKPWPERPQNYY